MMLYEKLKDKKQQIKELTALGVISLTVLRDLEIVEEFNKRPYLCKMCRYEVLAEYYGLKNVSSVKKIIEKYSK